MVKQFVTAVVKSWQGVTYRFVRCAEVNEDIILTGTVLKRAGLDLNELRGGDRLACEIVVTPGGKWRVAHVLGRQSFSAYLHCAEAITAAAQCRRDEAGAQAMRDAADICRQIASVA